MNAEYKQLFSEHKCCVVIPTYNNVGTIAQVTSSCLDYCDDVLVIDDGCTDGTREVLNTFGTRIVIARHEQNRGKGRALQTAFNKALEMGFAYAITIDADGQHKAKDLPVFLDKLKEEPNGIVIGARNMNQENVPGKSSFGHRFSNFWFWVETGIKAPDTQSGYRLYPLEPLKNIRFLSVKYEYEVEILVRAAWRGVGITSVPIEVYYPPQDERVSHFRPFRDFTRVSILNTILVFICFLYIKPRDLFIKIKNKGIKEILGSSKPTRHLAFSIGFGAFMGIFPIWGFQMLSAIPLSKLLRLNLPLVLISSNISMWPMTPIILYLSFMSGQLFVANPVSINFSHELTLEHISTGTVQFFLGGAILALLAGIVFFTMSYFTLSVYRKRKHGTIIH